MLKWKEVKFANFTNDYLNQKEMSKINGGVMLRYGQ